MNSLFRTITPSKQYFELSIYYEFKMAVKPYNTYSTFVIKNLKPQNSH